MRYQSENSFLQRLMNLLMAATRLGFFSAVPAISLLFQAAPPPIPASFYGTVTGSRAAEGTVIIAAINGTEYAQTLLQQVEDQWVYTLKIPADNPSTEPIEGGRPGDEIIFLVDGRPVATAPWQSGVNSRLDLSLAAEPAVAVASMNGTTPSTFTVWLAAAALIVVLVLVVLWQRRRLLAFGR